MAKKTSNRTTQLVKAVLLAESLSNRGSFTFNTASEQLEVESPPDMLDALEICLSEIEDPSIFGGFDDCCVIYISKSIDDAKRISSFMDRMPRKTLVQFSRNIVFYWTSVAGGHQGNLPVQIRDSLIRIADSLDSNQKLANVLRSFVSNFN